MMGDDARAAESPIEHVRIERRGGLAGLSAGVDCVYAALGDRERAALHRVLAAEAQGGAGPSARGADRFIYRLTLAHAGGAGRTLDVSEDAMPAALASLVRPALP